MRDIDISLSSFWSNKYFAVTCYPLKDQIRTWLEVLFGDYDIDILLLHSSGGEEFIA